MEGPTPVSSLIHAATMVTAGVFLLIRCASIFVYAPAVLSLIVVIGALTSLFGAAVALVQTDIKKIIAYSTCSQLGLMFMGCGVLQNYISLFHLVNHAFFKALLFLCAGLIIRGLRGEQDVRYMGGLINKSRELYCLMLVASLSLMGVPFFSGYFSKEALINVTYLSGTWCGYFGYCCSLLTTLLTSLYSIRLLYFVFFGEFRGAKKKALTFVAIPNFIRPYLYFLGFGSIFSGFFLKVFFTGVGAHVFYRSNC